MTISRVPVQSTQRAATRRRTGRLTSKFQNVTAPVNAVTAAGRASPPVDARKFDANLRLLVVRSSPPLYACALGLLGVGARARLAGASDALRARGHVRTCGTSVHVYCAASQPRPLAHDEQETKHAAEHISGQLGLREAQEALIRQQNVVISLHT